MTFENQYLTYNEYTSLGGEQIGETPFNLLEFDARQEIDKYTFGRLKTLTTQINEVKLCVYKIINYLYNNYNVLLNQKGGISSENIDGYSISYSNISSNEIMAKNGAIYDIVKTYLIDCKLENGTPYMYCGDEK